MMTLDREIAPGDSSRTAEEGPGSSSSADGKLKFAGDTGFHREVKRRVRQYFEESRRSPRDCPRMYLKTGVLLFWFGASYALLVFAATAWWQGVLLSVSLALSMAGIGFCIQHDANHGAYSNHRGVNRVMSLALDMLGASSYVWRYKHNVSHHTFTNVDGGDDDINIGPLVRLSPAQPRYPIHRVQQFFIWGLYALLMVKWHFVSDFRNVARARIARNHFPRPKGWSLVGLIGGKVFFYGWALVVPALFHPWWVVLLGYLGTSMVLSIVLSLVFQLAHCVEEADFPEPLAGTDQMQDAWAVHQVQTTVDFARENRLLTWYAGGLNFQIEHHLFPRICHIHYPRISEIVEQVSAEYGVRYRANKTFRGAITSHWRWLRHLGRPALVEPAG